MGIGQEGADEIRLTQDRLLQIGLRMCSIFCPLISCIIKYIKKTNLQFHLIHDTSLQQYWLTIPEAECTVMGSS
jgi:metal-sulfur cluster biosynthetic enzyme